MLLNINITKKCNLACTFCINDPRMSDDSKMIANLDDVLEDHLIENGDQYEAFTISGGEPLIDTLKLEKVLSVLLSHSLEKTITVNTNGCHLTPEMVDVFNAFPTVKLNISIDGLLAKERGLFKLLNDDYKRGYLTIELIKALKNKEISFVVTNEMLSQFSLALEVDMLQAYLQCPINISLDSTIDALNAFSIDDAFNFQLFVEKLEQLDLLNKTVIIKNFFNFHCTGSRIKSMSWDGTLYHECAEDGENCNHRRRHMKPGMYDLLRNIYTASLFKFDRKAADKADYDTSVGFVGKRYAPITPIRKNWVDNKIQIKQVN